jgi:hypothetical protein
LAQLQRRENVLTEALQRVAAETEAWTTIEKKWESEREPEQISKHADTVLAQWKGNLFIHSCFLFLILN